MTGGDIVVLAVLGLTVGLILGNLRKNRKRGCCGCCDGCQCQKECTKNKE